MPEFKVLKHQHWTFIFLIFSAVIFYFTLTLSSFQAGELFGINTIHWTLLTVLPIFSHQFYVLFCWRLELHHSSLTKLFGKSAFRVYEVGFYILLIVREIFMIPLSIANAGTLPIPISIRLIIVAIMAVPMIYTLYSVIRYFGMHRAAGADHFLPEYREIPFIKKGIYKYSSNSMYKYAFFIFWLPPLIFGSITGVLIAGFAHLYIWVHYYTLEKPDFKIIYGSKQSESLD